MTAVVAVQVVDILTGRCRSTEAALIAVNVHRSVAAGFIQSTEHSRGDPVFASLLVFFDYTKSLGRTEMRPRERKECQSIRTV